MASYRVCNGGGNGTPCPPPSAEEKRLLELLEQAPSARFTAILKCIPGWQFEGQANLRNWAGVLDKLKTQLVTAVEQCPRLLVAKSPSVATASVTSASAEAKDAAMGDDDERQLTEQVYQALRFLAILLENASNKHLFNAIESVVALMGARDENVAFEATHVFATLALLPQQHRHAVDPTAVQVDSPASSNGALRRRLIVLAQGQNASQSAGVDDFSAPWTGAAVKMTDEDVRKHLNGATVYQFYRQGAIGASKELVDVKFDDSLVEQLTASASSASGVIAGSICEQLIEAAAVPVEHQFPLLVRIRNVVAAVRPTRSAESTTIERLHALLALFYLFGESLDVASLVEQHPGLARGLTDLVRVEKQHEVPLRVRVTALQVLTALVYDRAERGGSGGILGRQSNVLQALGVAKGSPHGAFPSLVRFAMSELGQISPRVRGSSSSSAGTIPDAAAQENDADSNDMDMSLAVAFVQATSDLITPEDAEVLRVGLFRDPLHPHEGKLFWIEAVLVLLNQVVAMQSGAAILTESGVIPALLHVASSTAVSPFHVSLITLCIQALETTINTHTAAAALYRELNGVGMIIDRLQAEISASSTEKLSETTTVLIIALLVLLSVSFHSQGVMSAGATSRVIRDGSPLSKALIKILSNIDVFGPVVFAQAAIVVSDIVNNDPSSVNQVHAGGIADAFLKTLTRWNVAELRPVRILPASSELIMAIPSVLSALCLTSAHAEKVARYKPLLFLFDCFATPQYAAADCDHLQGDTTAIVGSGVFEMMRQVSGFQAAAIQACVEAAKKLLRFGEECESSNLQTIRQADEKYRTLLRMVTHFCDVLEPILSKVEHASSFSDHGGVQCLLKLYRLILPTAPAFLSSLLVARGGNKGHADRGSLMTHQPAAHSITVALRSFASQQPAKMLSAVMIDISKQVEELRAQRSDISGLFSSLPDVELVELFDDEGVEQKGTGEDVGRKEKLQGISQYLRQLAFIEWLVGVLTWTMQTAQNSLQSRHWFSELLSRTNTGTLEKLFAVSRGVQRERAALTASHRSQSPDAVENDQVAASANKMKGLWKLCSLLLLRFSSVSRGLLVKMSKTFVSTPIQHRRADDSVLPLAMHAHNLARLVATTLRADIDFALSETTGTAHDEFATKYYLIFVLETVMQTVFDSRTKQANALVLHKLLHDEATRETSSAQPFSCLHAMIAYLMGDCLPVASSEANVDADARMRELCVRVGASALQHISDLETLRTSPLTVSLVTGEDSASAGLSEHERFDLRKLSVKLHCECLDLVLRLWQDPRVRTAHVEKYAQELLPAVVMILRHRLDVVDSTPDTSRNGLDALQQRLRDRGRRHESGNPFADFAAGAGGALDRDDFLQALFGGIGQPGRNSHSTGRNRPFEVDPATVDSLVAMGFPRARVERAIRRTRVNDVEVAMEWLLSHPDDEDGDDDDEDEEGRGGNATNDDAGTPQSSGASTSGAQNAESSAPAAPQQNEEERALFDGYATLREGFEEGCLAILRHQAPEPVVSPSMTGASANENVYELQNFVLALAQYLALLCLKVDDERQKVIARVSEALVKAISTAGESDRFIMMLAHLLAVVLQLDASSVDTLLKQSPSCVDAIMQFIQHEVATNNKARESYAPLLLVVDTIQASDVASADRPIASVANVTESSEPSAQPRLSVAVRRSLVRLSVQLMSSSDLSRNTAHALWQLLVRITLDYEVATELLNSEGGIELLLSLRETAVFPGYTELTAALFVQLLESPQVLEQMMEEKIEQAIKKLSERYGPPSQMRITPRVLMMEVAPYAARSEKIFMQALRKTLTFKKTESGRVYVVEKKAMSAPAREGQAPTPASRDDQYGDKEKKTLHKLPKSHRLHAQSIVNLLATNIRSAWQVEKFLPETRSLDEDESSDHESSALGVGTYLHLLTQVVATFPACAAVLTKHAGSDHEGAPPASIIHLVLQELLPCKALCRFATIRRVSLGDDSGALDSDARQRDALTVKTKERVTSAHTLLVTIGTQPGDGPKVIVGELVRLFQSWPTSVNKSAAVSDGDLSVEDEDALSALHAWSALIMSILWPKGTASKSLSWDKVVLGGGLTGKYSFVTLLVNALRKISLSHPFAYSACTMLLRPLTTLTRPFVTHRVKKLLKKRTASTSAEGNVENEDMNVTSSESSIHASGVSADLNSALNAGSTEPHTGGDDVTMTSPADLSVDHEMHDSGAEGPSDDESERSSDSGRSSDLGRSHLQHHREEERDEHEGDEDEDEEDEEEEDEDEDGDDDDEDEDEDEDEEDDDEEMEEEGRIRLRASRRQVESGPRGRASGSRPWTAFGSEGGNGEGFDEVDEDEFSYLRLLDDEAFVSSQAQAVRLRQSARARATREGERSSAPSALTGSPLLRSLVDMFSLDGGSHDASESQMGVFAFGDDDDDEDDPDMAFRHREHLQTGATSSSNDVASMGSALVNLLEDRSGQSNATDFIFETVDAGAASAVNPRLRGGTRDAAAESPAASTSLIHPLLRSSTSATQQAPTDREARGGGLGGFLPDRLPLARHAPSLFRELNVLVRQMNSNLGFAPGAEALLGRDLLRHAGGGRTRPPSRNRLSAVSNLLSEFSLDIPTTRAFGHGRQHRGAGTSLRRGERELIGGRGGLRGDWGFDSLSAQLAGGPAAANADARAMAARLEQFANQLVEPDAPSTSTPATSAPQPSNDRATSDRQGREEAPSQPPPDVADDETVGSSGESGREAQSGARDDASDQAQANETGSDTASVIALASSLSLRSPQDDAGSDNEAPSSPRTSTQSVGNEAPSIVSSSSSSAILPPPAPTVAAPASGSLLDFTLDLTSFQPPAPPQASADVPAATENVVEEEMKSEDEDVGDASSAAASGELVCPEGVDPEVFAFLPPDMQAEIVAQHAPPAPPTRAQAAPTTGADGSESFSQMDLDMANSSFDRETLEALPEDIRAEVLANERRERETAARAAEPPADVSRAEEMDNASFVASLAPGLREEILTTCDDAFLQTLPTQVQAEAMVLRERAAYRPAFHEPRTTTGLGATGDDDTTGDIFRRPTLRRMLTSQGPDIFSAARRSGRGRGGDGSSSRGRSGRDEASASAHAGMIRVLRDEDEEVDDRILEDASIRALLRLLFMSQSIVHTRVFQRLLTNVCLYPLTRESVRLYLMRIISAPLPVPLVLKNADDESTVDFPPQQLYGTRVGLSSGWTSLLMKQAVPPEVISRVLLVLVTLAKQNPRFAVDMLRHHGMLRKGLAHSGSQSESGAEVLIELLEVPVVSRSATHLETLLELLELILLPLDRLKRKLADDEEKKENDEDAKPVEADTIDWVHVTQVILDARRTGSLVSVLTVDICTPTMQERTIQILKLLDRVPANRPVIMDALVQQAKRLATTDRFRSSSPATSSVFESSAVLKSAQDELTLLRLLHTLSDVCETTSDFNDCCATIGLDALWEALSQSLDEARVISGGAIETTVAAAGTPRSGERQVVEDDQTEGMVIEGKSAGASIAMAALLARFLPMVEAFFVVSARDAASMPLRVPDSMEREEAVVTALRESGLDSVESMQQARLELKRMTSVTASDAGSDGIRLANFVEANRVLLNLLVREKPSLLDASLAALVKLPRCRAYLDFDNKRTYFQSAMKKLRQTALRSQVGSAAVRLAVRRDHIFEDSYYALRMRSGAELRRKLHISFTGEEGIDAGGVTREWYVILAREIFNPNYVLFTSAADSPTFQPNPLSYVNKDHLSYFEFVGKVIGKAVADGQLLDAHFTRSFYKHILQLPISYHDMEAIDPEYYRNLHSILDNAIEDLGLELTFSAEQSNFGRMEIVDLIPNGRNIAVTDDNKMEYVKLVTHHRMATGIRQQIDAFLKGFHQLVPPEMISIFNENELELLISGMPEIDIDDLKANTDYANYKPTDSVIRWFWNVLYSCTHEERALFLQFVTGTSKVPLEGFKALEGMRGTHKFNIHKAFGNPNALPSAHTCFNQLDLPEYESEEKLRQCLLLAIREGSEGFGFG